MLVSFSFSSSCWRNRIRMVGFTVFAGVRKESDGKAVTEECLKSHSQSICDLVIPVILDVTKEETIQSTHAVVQAWVEKTGLPLVALVNNAGITHAGAVETVSLDVYRNGLLNSKLLTVSLVLINTIKSFI